MADSRLVKRLEVRDLTVPCAVSESCAERVLVDGGKLWEIFIAALEERVEETEVKQN